jgi:hypothetical protein
MKWISVKDGLPDELETVNIVFVNHNPQIYYADIKDKPMTATAIYCKGKWWWWSAVCEDYLAEYGRSICDEMDIDIEVTHWMPLPEPPSEEDI